MKSDSKGFIEYFENIKNKLNNINKNVYTGLTAGFKTQLIEDVQLYRYVNY